jgi:hypothetical protein
MKSVANDPDPRVLRYVQYCGLRHAGADDDQIAAKFGRAPQTLYAMLAQDGFPVCRTCGNTPAEQDHCKPLEKQRKGRSSAGPRTGLPPAAEALPLFYPVVDAFNEYLLDLTTLKEVYGDERFEAVDHNEATALVDLEGNTSFGPTTVPLGARLDPPHPLVALIAAYVIEDQPLDPLLEKLLPSTAKLNRQKLDEKVEALKLAARQVAKLMRGGIVRTGRRTEELTAREHDAVEYITSRLRSGVPESEIDENLRRRGFIRSDIRRLKKFRLDFPS